MTLPTEIVKKTTYQRWEELYLKRRESSLSREESNEWADLDRRLREQNDSEYNATMGAFYEKQDSEDRKEKEKARLRTRSAAETVATVSTKLAYDKQTKPNLTVASTCYLRRNLTAFVQNSFYKNRLGWSSFISIHDMGKIDSSIPFASGLQSVYVDEGNKDNPASIGSSAMYEFLNLTSLQYTTLKPMVKLSKIFLNKEGKISDEVEIVLPTDGKEKIATELLMPTTSDAGLKRVRVDFRNQNPFAAGRMVDVELEIF